MQLYDSFEESKVSLICCAAMTHVYGCEMAGVDIRLDTQVRGFKQGNGNIRKTNFSKTTQSMAWRALFRLPEWRGVKASSRLSYLASAGAVESEGRQMKQC